jgi:GDP-L-fucose synthase
MLDWPNLRVTVTGGGGFVGQVICAKLKQRGCKHIHVPRRADYDLTNEANVEAMYAQHNPDVVIHLAAEVGGIGANKQHPGRFFFANMAMGMHLIEHGRRHGLTRFVQTGTVCAYPKFALVPFKEDALWDGFPEETNAPYGIAKKSLFLMLDAYQREYNFPGVVVVPVNLYGPGDNFDLQTSHVIPALIRKCMSAIEKGDPSIECWGTGSASREFLYVDDAAEGILVAADKMEQPTPINLGTGREITIKALVELIARLCGFAGQIKWDASKPDGQPRRCLDVSRAQKLLDWQASVDMEEGLTRTIEWFKQQTSLREIRYGE